MTMPAIAPLDSPPLLLLLGLGATATTGTTGALMMESSVKLVYSSAFGETLPRSVRRPTVA